MARSKATMQLGARHAEVVQNAIQHWLDSSTLSHSQAAQLADTIVVQTFDWEKFAKYTLRAAIVCLVIAVSSIVFEASFIRVLHRIVALPPALRGAATALIAVGVHVVAHQRSLAVPKQKYANEGIHAIGALLFALAAFQVLEQLHAAWERKRKQDKSSAPQSKEEDKDDEEARERRRKENEQRDRIMNNAIRAVSLGLASVYATVGLISKSNLIWTCCMMVLGYSFGAFAGYIPGVYWIGTDSPVAFTAFGCLVTGAATLMRSYAITEPLWATTRIWGLLYVFIPLWILSLFGHDDYFSDSKVKQYLSVRIRILLWSVVFFLAACTSIWHGLRYDDSTTKGFGLTFLGINLYTKFFECFWGWYKPLVFAILAASFAVIGKYAENVWNMSLESL